MELLPVLEKIRNLRQPNSEESTKLQAILPILHCLGWDSADPNKLEAEYPVGKGRADYVLFGSEGSPVAIVEAKKADTRIGPPKGIVHETEFRQVIEYAFHKTVPIVIYTTGFKWFLLFQMKPGTTVEQRIFAKMDIKTDPLDRLTSEFEKYLSYDALISGKALTHAKNALDEKLKREQLAKELPRIWNAMLKEPPEELMKLINRRIESEGLPLYKEEISGFLSEQIRNISEPAHLQPTNSIPHQKNKRSGQPSPTGYRLWKEQYSVKYWKDILRGVAEALYLRHPEQFEWKVRDTSGLKIYVNVGNSGMKSPYQIGNSRYWIETHASAHEIVRRCENLLKLFGYSGEDLEIEHN